MRVRKNIAEPVVHMKVKVKILLLRDQNAAVAHAALDMGDGIPFTVEATGSAKREQGDTRDDTIAADLAVGRALVKLGHRLQQTGSVQVESATAQANRRKAAAMERVLRGMKPRKQVRLQVSEIQDRFGPEAAERAARRRTRMPGRHARDAQKEQE